MGRTWSRPNQCAADGLSQRWPITSLPVRLEDRGKDQHRRIQMIYQMADVALNPRQTLLDIIGRPVAFYFNKSRAEIRPDWLDEVLRRRRKVVA